MYTIFKDEFFDLLKKGQCNMYLYFNIYTLKIDLENSLLKIRFFATQDVSETLFIKMYTLNSIKGTC